jgi:hypothetical protein
MSLADANVPLYRSYHVDLRILVEAGVLQQATIDASSP